MDLSLFKEMFETHPCALALFEILLDDRGNPVDIILANSNGSFQKAMEDCGIGFSGGSALTPLSVLCSYDTAGCLQYFSHVALDNMTEEFEFRASLNSRIYRVTVYSPRPQFFNLQFSDISSTVKLFESSPGVCDGDDSVNCQLLCDKMLMLSQSLYTSLNLEDGAHSKRAAVSGVNERIISMISSLDLNSPGSAPVLDLEGSSIAEYASLGALAGNDIPPAVVSSITELFNLGKVYLVRIKEQDRVSGCFTLLMKRGDILNNRSIVGLHARQTALYLDRQKIKKKLSKSQSYLENIMLSSQDGLSVLSRDLEILHTNSTMKKWYRGALPLEGKKCFNCYHNKTSPCNDCPSLRCLDSGLIEKKVVKGPEDSNPSKWLELICYPMKDLKSGEITGVIEFVRDVTGRINAEEKLKISEENFRNFYMSMDDMILTCDKKGQILQVNDTLCHTLGFSHQDLLGGPVSRIYPEDSKATVNSVLNRMEVTGRLFKGDTLLQHKSGSLIPVHINLWQSHWNGIDCTMGLARNMTTVRELSDKYTKIFDSNPNLLAVTTYPELCFMEVNRSFLDVLGFEKSELIGKCLSDLKLFINEQEYLEMRERSVKTGTVKNHAMDIQGRNGQKLHILLSTELIKTHGQTYYLIIITDISNQKSAEEKALEASSAKSDFLAKMSHEFRTPINGVTGFLNLLNKTPLNAEQCEYLEKARFSARSLLEIVSDILDFSRIEAGKMTLEPTWINLEKLLRKTSDIVECQADEKGLVQHLILFDSLPERVYCDAVRLKQILINLLSNAVKFTDEGEISLSAGFCSVRDNQGIFSFTVSDTGIGISEDLKPHLFNAFYQADSTAARKFGGTGLGLAITKSLVERMDGKITLDSKPGRGTIFSIEIPLKYGQPSLQISQETADRVISSVSETVSTPRILVAEDNKLNKLLIKSLFKRFLPEAEVLMADSGLKVLEHLNEFNPDLILMDVQMPEMDGIEATVKIRGMDNDLGRKVPIIALTAGAFLSEKEKCLNAGMNDFLTKPFQDESLITTVKKYL